MAIIKKKAKKANKGGKGQIKIDWLKVKTAWLAKNLDPATLKKYSLLQLSKDFSIDYSSLALHAKSGGWEEELKHQAAVVTQQAVDNLIADAVESEGQIRIRQSEIAKKAQAKALEGIEILDPELMSAKDIINLARLGLQEERKALGFADRIEFDDLSKQKTDDYESPMEKAAKAKTLNALSDRLLKAMTKNDDG